MVRLVGKSFDRTFEDSKSPITAADFTEAIDELVDMAPFLK